MAEKSKAVRTLPLLAILLLLLLAATATLIWLTGAARSDYASAQRDLTRLTLLSQTMPQQAAAAMSGEEQAFDALAASRSELVSAREDLARRASAAAGPLPAPAPMPELDDAAWEAFLKDVDGVLDIRDPVLLTHQEAARVAELMQQLLTEFGNFAGRLDAARLQQLGPEIQRFELTGQRIPQDMHALTHGLGNPELIVERLTEDEAYLNQMIGGLAGQENDLGIEAVVRPEALEMLPRIEALFRQASEEIRDGIATTDVLIDGHQAVRLLSVAGDERYAALRSATEAGRTDNAGFLYGPMAPLTLLGLALLVLLAMMGIYYSAKDMRKAAEFQARQNEANQAAILRLLDELGSLADGDLTVQATVTEDITGAIADSINYAIEALRELVTTIKGSALMLDSAARQTEATAGHLAEASETQSRQISAATDSVTQMAKSIEEVSGNAERSSDVARHSVNIAHKGGDAVRRTIDGMNTIRETIQETSKRIKRLGESSQEIGNIVELINDIAEQTNVLALNASIQASMAGESGRGFAVVADEVQRLAERSANATKQIEVLVRTIQSDTNEAVVSMERSTTDVVGGALLAENAGAALEEIEQVSNQIASLVQNISSSARQQSSQASDFTRNMNVLSEISAQAAESTSAASSSISKLAELATQLRTSIAGFTLSDPTGSTIVQEAEPRAAPAASRRRPTEPEDDGLDIESEALRDAAAERDSAPA
ncbi:MAG: methyl-accepting chemotaxis protein [Gammaproteobacteria bacterium]|nr:methyl-accepting chemotaxis protein [Gammaproteobacteria bacterium]